VVSNMEKTTLLIEDFTDHAVEKTTITNIFDYI